MHERTERAIARLLFVFCCAVPTFFTLAVVVVTWTPWYHNRQLAAIQERLSRDTGLVVTVEDFAQLSPYMCSLMQVRVCEPETNLEVASVRRITWIREDDRIGVAIHQPEFQSAQLENAWQLIHDRFLCRPELTSLPITITANDLNLHSKTGAMPPMQDVKMWIKPRSKSVQAKLQCYMAGDSQSPVELTITRDRSTTVPKTNWTLETGSTALPCSALAGYLPMLKRLGDEAEFNGQLQWESTRDGDWSVDLDGARFTTIDLGSVFENLPHSIRGKADVILDRCRIVRGQTVDLAGTFRSSGGWIRTSLLRAMESQLKFVVDPQSANDPSGEVLYELFAVHFDVNNWELKLKGSCRSEKYYDRVRSGIAMIRANRELALSDGEVIATTDLARAIAPMHSELVPISSQTAWLVDLFIPPKHPIQVDSGVLPSPIIKRVGHATDGEPVRQR